jgi:hypothetical protein
MNAQQGANLEGVYQVIREATEICREVTALVLQGISLVERGQEMLLKQRNPYGQDDSGRGRR